jgi:hypothetical protein
MTDWTTILLALVPHPHQPLVLAQLAGTRLVLPRMVHPARIWASDTLTLTPLFAALVGEPINILRWVAFHRDEGMQTTFQIHLLEPREKTILIPALWQPLDSILEGDEMPAALHEGLARWQAEQRSGLIPEQRAPWGILGWQAEVKHWIGAQVNDLGWGAIQSIDSIKSWSISFVLRVNTEAGVLYFKATRELPLWVNEGLFQTRLAEMYPGQIPVPIAMNTNEGWMLLEDFGEPLGNDAPLELQTRMLQDFAHMQLVSSYHIAQLFAASCKDRRLRLLGNQLDSLVMDDIIFYPVEAEKCALLRAKFEVSLPRFKDLIAQLDALPIPPTIIHGDLHAGNVVLRNDRIVFFDWTDAAISHPFVDMIHIFQEKDDETRAVLQEAYLSVWEGYFLKESVRNAWALAQVVFGLYHAVSYYYIAHGIEPSVRSELNAAWFYIQFALDQLEKYDEELLTKL